jgi:membrane-bound metal-dependent hydrolase YbcI (DUF457 family)
VLSTLVNSITLCKTGESQLTRGEIWAEFAQLSVLPLATLVTLSLDMIPLFSFNGVTFCRKISNFYMGVKNKSGRSRLFTTCFFFSLSFTMFHIFSKSICRAHIMLRDLLTQR